MKKIEPSLYFKILDAVSHDLKSPIASLQSITAVMALKKEKLTKQEIDSYLKKIETQTAFLHENIDAVLHSVAVIEKTLQYSYEFFDLQEIIVRSLAVIKRRTAQTIKIIKNEAGVVVADKEKLQIAVLTVLEHCLRFSDSLSSVVLSAEVIKKQNYITIGYLGKPIIKKTFAEVLTLEEFLPKITKSLRLSLYVAILFIEASKGKIAFSSQSGQKQSIVISFPAKT